MRAVIIRPQLLACSPPFSTPSMIHIFEASLSHLWSIWECLVLCEPIIIFGQSPTWTSNAIWWFRDIVRPVRDPLQITCSPKPTTTSQIPWVGDFRPYFTIHDREYQDLINGRAPKAGLLVGVTNPFFEKTCSHWPHVLTLGGKFWQVEARYSSAVSDTFSSHPNPSTRLTSPGPSPGWKTKTHKRYTSKDRQLLQTLEITAGNGNTRACESRLAYCAMAS
jgi:hypothetical protein